MSFSQFQQDYRVRFAFVMQILILIYPSPFALSPSLAFLAEGLF